MFSLKSGSKGTIDRVSGNFFCKAGRREWRARESKQAYADLEQRYQRLQVQMEQQRQALGRIPAVEFAGAGVLVTAMANSRPQSQENPSCQL